MLVFSGMLSLSTLVFKNLFILALWKKAASALKGSMKGSITAVAKILPPIYGRQRYRARAHLYSSSSAGSGGSGEINRSLILRGNQGLPELSVTVAS